MITSTRLRIRPGNLWILLVGIQLSSKSILQLGTVFRQINPRQCNPKPSKIQFLCGICSVKQYFHLYLDQRSNFFINIIQQVYLKRQLGYTFHSSMVSNSGFSYLWVLILDYRSLLKLKFKIKDLLWLVQIFYFLKKNLERHLNKYLAQKPHPGFLTLK